MTRFALIALTVSLAANCPLVAADWNQWRGSRRDGADHDSPALIKQLPADGLRPVWVAEQQIPSARSGGWSCPVVAVGTVFL